jgi:hypothetical protein
MTCSSYSVSVRWVQIHSVSMGSSRSMIGTITAANLIGRTAVMAASTAGSASCWSCGGMTCGSASPAGTSNVSLSRARGENSDARRVIVVQGAFRHTIRDTYVRHRRYRPTFLSPLSRRFSISSPRSFGPLSGSVQGACVRRGGAPGSPNLASIEYFPAPVTYNRKKPPMRLTFL